MSFVKFDTNLSVKMSKKKHRNNESINIFHHLITFLLFQIEAVITLTFTDTTYAVDVLIFLSNKLIKVNIFQKRLFLNTLLLSSIVVNLAFYPPPCTCVEISYPLKSLAILCRESFPIWISFLVLILSNDVKRNPGDPQNGLLSFCNWNLNSLSKDNKFRCLRLTMQSITTISYPYARFLLMNHLLFLINYLMNTSLSLATVPRAKNREVSEFFTRNVYQLKFELISHLMNA